MCAEASSDSCSEMGTRGKGASLLRNCDSAAVEIGSPRRERGRSGRQTVQVMLAHALASGQPPNAAVAVLSAVLSIAPDEADALLLRGQILVQLNDPASALEDFDSLLRLRPDLGQRADVRAARSRALVLLGRVEEGEAGTH